MRKFLLTFLACVLFASQVFAGPENVTIITETQLDNDPFSATSSTFNIQEYDKLGFFVKYDETEVGGGVNVNVTLDISYDGTNWVDALFYDYTGALTPQTSENLASDKWYYCWFDPDMNAPYVRMSIDSVFTDVDDIAKVTAYMVGTK